MYLFELIAKIATKELNRKSSWVIVAYLSFYIHSIGEERNGISICSSGKSEMKNPCHFGGSNLNSQMY
jgi:hypothetical protein